jgi:hypothetical protein
MFRCLLLTNDCCTGASLRKNAHGRALLAGRSSPEGPQPMRKSPLVTDH